MLRKKMINECPIQCRHERCKDKWSVNVTQAPKTSAEVQNGNFSPPTKDRWNAFWTFWFKIFHFFFLLTLFFSGGCVDESQACDGVKPLCREDKYIDTLQTYCRATCEFCTPDETSSEAKPGQENYFWSNTKLLRFQNNLIFWLNLIHHLTNFFAVDNSGACVNQYDNCEGMKFLCNDSSNEYSARWVW